MKSLYLGYIPFADALKMQSDLVESQTPAILGFETGPLITLGRRASAADLLIPPRFEVLTVDRGGQATLHNPGQLVIFPIVPVTSVRRWVERLSDVTRTTLLKWQIESAWNADHPGLYTERGKIMACGIRLRRQFSTHGLAINVCNDLSDFATIRACGRTAAALDRIGPRVKVQEVFEAWFENFTASHG